MGVLYTILIGFLVGLVARFVKPGNDSMGFIATTLLGIVGAFVGAYLGQIMGVYEAGEPTGFIGAVVGSIVVLAVIHLVAGKRSIA